MYHSISIIPTSVRQGFKVCSLPLRSEPVNEETLKTVFGGCPGQGESCDPFKGDECCRGTCFESARGAFCV